MYNCLYFPSLSLILFYPLPSPFLLISFCFRPLHNSLFPHSYSLYFIFHFVILYFYSSLLFFLHPLFVIHPLPIFTSSSSSSSLFFFPSSTLSSPVPLLTSSSTLLPRKASESHFPYSNYAFKWTSRNECLQLLIHGREFCNFLFFFYIS